LSGAIFTGILKKPAHACGLFCFLPIRLHAWQYPQCAGGQTGQTVSGDGYDTFT
jgi:hypothetical protein